MVTSATSNAPTSTARTSAPPPTTARNRTEPAPTGEGRDPQSSALSSPDFNSFLTLLTAQLRNQDPLNPQDPTQFVAQLASFSSVEQQVTTNSLLQGIASALGGEGDLLQTASAWIGNDVETTVNTISFQGDSISLIVPPGAQGESRDIVIRDQAGREVFREEAGSTSRAFEWNGRNNAGLVAPQGVYRARVETENAEGDVSEVELVTRARVEEARVVDGAVQLVLSDGATASPTAVRAVLASSR